MGCGGSKDSVGNSPASGNHVVYDRRPKISVRIGNEVQKYDNRPTVIFIFGECKSLMNPPFPFTARNPHLPVITVNCGDGKTFTQRFPVVPLKEIHLMKERELAPRAGGVGCLGDVS